MCAPALAVMAVAGGVSAYAQAKGREKQLLAFDTDAAALETAAGDARARGDVDAQRTQLAEGMVAGRERAAYAAGGVDASSGSAADVQATTQAFARLDADTVRANAMKEAWGLGQQSGAIKRRRKDLKDSQLTQDFASLLGGAGNLMGAAGGNMGRKGGG